MIYKIHITGEAMGQMFESTDESDARKISIRYGLPEGCRLVNCFTEPHSNSEHFVLVFSDSPKEEECRVVPAIVKHYESE